MSKDKTMRSCENCEFNFDTVCAGHGTRTDNGADTYGMPMDDAKKMFENGCDGYRISFNSFVEQHKIEDVL